MHLVFLAVCCLLSGHVGASSGAPVASARISVDGAVSATSDERGVFSLAVAPGVHRLDVSARGFATSSVDLRIDEDSRVDVTLAPLDAPTLRTIASVSVNGQAAISRNTMPSVTITRADMERMGDDRIVQALQTLPGATFARPDGGSSTATAVVALRGPDPSESLVTLDGQTLNDGNTGDLDLSQFAVAAFSAAHVTEGLGPQDSNGSNTFGGAINLVSLQPTQKPQFTFGESVGSFGRSELFVNETGSRGKLGYAVALDDAHQQGYASGVVPLFSALDPQCQPCRTQLGSSVAARTELVGITWSPTRRSQISARAFALADTRDQSGSINGIDGTNPASPTFGAFIGPGNQTISQVVRAYQVRGQMPLGAGDLVADLSANDDSLSLDGNPGNPAYDVTHVDKRYNLGLSWERTFDRSQYAIGGYTRYESLAYQPPQPELGQTIDVLFVRGGTDASSKLHVDAGVYASRYTTFGSNTDARLGAIYTADASTALRFSFGTGFRAPLLIERYAFPLDQLPQDAFGVFVGQGSANERPEHASEYELGLSHRFVTGGTIDVSLYRTNLRNPIEVYYPVQLALSGACAGQTPAAPVPGCVSYQSNVGNAVYEGAEVRFFQRFAREHMDLSASYGLNVAYPKDLTAAFSNPTSGANLVNNQQFPGIPQQQGALELAWADNGLHASAQAIFRGTNNELNRGPLTFVNATFGFKVNEMTDITFVGTNLLNDGASRYTIFGGGAPYLGVGGVPVPTDRLGVEPAGVRMMVTLRA